MLGIHTKRISGVIFTISIIFLFGLSGNDSFAQQVTTPSGSRSMVQKGIFAEGSGGIIAKFDLRYTVSWKAKTCEQPRPYGTRPQVVAWVTDYTVEGVEYKDEHFSAAEFGQGTLKNGIEIVRLNSGIEAEVKSLESGKSVKLDKDWIPAEPQKRDVCDMDATEIFRYDLSRDEHEVRITNTNRTRSNKIRIKRNLWEAIVLKAIDSKMNKARTAAGRGDKGRAQQIAMNARNLCPGGGSFNSATECEIEISEFLRELSGNGANEGTQDQANTRNSSGGQESSNENLADEYFQDDQEKYLNNSDDNSADSNGNNNGDDTSEKTLEEKLEEQREEIEKRNRERKELEEEKAEAVAKMAKGAGQMLDAILPPMSGGSGGFVYTTGAKTATYTARFNFLYQLNKQYHNSPLVGAVLNVGGISINRPLQGGIQGSYDEPIETMTLDGYTTMVLGAGLVAVIPTNKMNTQFAKVEAIWNGFMHGSEDPIDYLNSDKTPLLIDYNIGYSFRFSQKWAIGLELGYRNLKLEYVDEASQDHVIEDSALFIGLNLTMAEF